MAKKEKNNKKGRKEEKPQKKGFFARFFGFLLRLFIKFLIGVLISTVILAIAGFLLYNYYPIKTMNVCVNNTPTVTQFSCTSDSECAGKIFSQDQKTPEFVRNFMKTTFSDLVKCTNNKCEVRMPRGFDQPEGECLPGEEARKLEITARKIIPPETLISAIKQFIATGKMPFQQ